jgi:hypothetical protein
MRFRGRHIRYVLHLYRTIHSVTTSEVCERFYDTLTFYADSIHSLSCGGTLTQIAT